MPYVWDAHGTLREAFSLYNCRPLSSRAACFGTRKARVMCERWRVIVPDSVKLTLINERCARCAVESSKGSTPCDINIFLRRSCPFHRPRARSASLRDLKRALGDCSESRTSSLSGTVNITRFLHSKTLNKLPHRLKFHDHKTYSNCSYLKSINFLPKIGPKINH